MASYTEIFLMADHTPASIPLGFEGVAPHAPERIVIFGFCDLMAHYAVGLFVAVAACARCIFAFFTVEYVPVDLMRTGRNPLVTERTRFGRRFARRHFHHVHFFMAAIAVEFLVSLVKDGETLLIFFARPKANRKYGRDPNYKKPMSRSNVHRRSLPRSLRSI
jgi:hypothetical protein